MKKFIVRSAILLVAVLGAMAFSPDGIHAIDSNEIAAVQNAETIQVDTIGLDKRAILPNLDVSSSEELKTIASISAHNDPAVNVEVEQSSAQVDQSVQDAQQNKDEGHNKVAGEPPAKESTSLQTSAQQQLSETYVKDPVAVSTEVLPTTSLPQSVPAEALPATQPNQSVPAEVHPTTQPNQSVPAEKDHLNRDLVSKQPAEAMPETGKNPLIAIKARDVTLPTLEIRGLISSEGREYDTNRLQANVSNGMGVLSYYYLILDSNNKAIKTATTPYFDWYCTKSGHYNVQVTVKDGYNRTVSKTFGYYVAPTAIQANINVTSKDPKQFTNIGIQVDAKYAFQNTRTNIVVVDPSGKIKVFYNKSDVNDYFNDAGRYFVKVYVRDAANRLGTATQILDVKANPVVITDLRITNSAAPRVYENLYIRAFTEGGDMNKRYTITVTDPAKKTKILSLNGKGFATFYKFTYPGRYILGVTVKDGTGYKQKKLTSVFIKDDPISFNISLLPGDKVRVNSDVMMTSSIVGGGRITKSFLHLFYNGRPTFLSTNIAYNQHRFTKPGNYTYLMTVYDQAGRKWLGMKKISVSTDGKAAVLKDLRLNRASYLQDLANLVQAKIDLERSIPGASYEYWVMDPAKKLRCLATSTSTHFKAIINDPGNYTLYAILRAPNSDVESIKSDFVVRPNIPVLNSVTADLSEYHTKRLITVTNHGYDIYGKPTLKYYYYAHSWKHGNHRLGINTSKVMTWKIDDPSVFAIRTIVVDARGKMSASRYTTFELPHAWDGIDKNISNTVNANKIELSWAPGITSTGFIIMRNGREIARVKSNRFIDSNFKSSGLAKYEVIPYYGFMNRKANGKLVAETFTPHTRPFTKVELITDPYAIELRDIINNYSGRQRVAMIGRWAKGKIKYEYDADPSSNEDGTLGKATVPGWVGNNFSNVFTDNSTRGLNCSGFVKWVFKTAGYTDEQLGDWRWTTPLMASTLPISYSDVQIGDIAFMDGLYSNDNHVGIYVGDGLWSHLPRPGTTVLVDRPSYWIYYRRPKVFL